jgi:hypothetical protein
MRARDRPDESICEVCNRAGMATPSATHHGTIVVAIVAGVIIMAIAASLAPGNRGRERWAGTNSRTDPRR